MSTTSASPQPRPRRRAAVQAVALTSLGAGVIHLALGPEHLREWVVLGSGFFASGAMQLLWGAALLRRESRRVLLLGALGSLAFIAVWAVSRTSGLPVGPEAYEPEAVGTADLLCIGLEAVAAAGALLLLRRPDAGAAPAGRFATRGIVAAVGLAVLATTGVAVASPEPHDHGAPCPTAAVRTGVDANHNGADDGVEAYFACQLLHEHDHHTGYVAPKL
ncbi:MAG: hypothetical protein ACXVGH_13240 [Mycobacteriales bacterium]